MLGFFHQGYTFGHHHSEIRVRVIHQQSEGYPLAADGQEIKEEMQLEEFLRRIFSKGEAVKIEIGRVVRALHGGGHHEIESISEKYNQMYIDLFTRQRAQLAQHSMRGIGMMGQFTDPFDHRQSQHMSNYEQDYRRQQAMMEMSARAHVPSHGLLNSGPSQAEKSLALKKSKLAEEKKKRDDDLFYLTT